MKKIALFEFIPTWYDVSELTELHLYPDNANKVTLLRVCHFKKSSLQGGKWLRNFRMILASYVTIYFGRPVLLICLF